MWKKKSIDERLKILNILTFVIVALLVIISVMASVNGMNSLKLVLDNNEKTRNVCDTIENEGKAFNNYLNTEQPQAFDALAQAGLETENALKELPSDYSKMTPQQYAQTNSIKNAYGEYQILKQQIIGMNSQDITYKGYVSKYYEMQKYLENYANRLQTMTMKQSSERYQTQQKLFFMIPAICIITGILVIVIFAWFKHYIRNMIIKPVMELSDQAKRIAENDFSGERLVAEGEDEIAVLVNSFDEMRESTRNYISTMEEKHQVEKQLVETRYQMLKNQINPHFLFNTLNLIASTAEIEDAETTEKMIVTLSRLFRYNLKSQTTVMPLEQELKVVADYMYLQQMRFGQRIKYIASPEEETLQVLVPSFVLQPLVENSIVHGLSKSSKGGIIVVRSWMKEGVIWISVADTGEGMDEDTCENLRKKLNEAFSTEPLEIRKKTEKGNEKTKASNEKTEVDDEKAGTGIALQNIGERIQGMYADSGFRLFSKKDHGTVIQLYMGGNSENV